MSFKDKLIHWRDEALAREQKALNHEAVQKTVSWFGSPKGFALVLLLIAFVYSFKVEHHPGLHGDELSLLAIPYRAVEFNDYNYPLIFSDSYNAGPIRSYPPIMSMMLRSIWHKTVGFSDYSSRLFSGLMMAAIAALFGALVLQRTARNWKMAVMALVCIAFSPGVVAAARTVRFEQEIIFMGALAFLLPLLLLRNCGVWQARMVWVISGLCAAWAGFSHPWGMIFPFILVVSFLFMHKSWNAEDRLGWFGRIFFFGIGCFLPFAVTALQVGHDWPRFQDYMKEMGDFYALRQDQLVNYFLNRYNIPLEPSVLGRIVSNLLQLHMAGYAATATVLAGIDVLPIGFLFQIVFWGFIASLFMWKQNQEKPFHVRIWIYLALGFIGFNFMYVPNQIYAIYPAVFVVAAALMLRVSCDCRYLAAGMRAYMALSLLFVVSYMVYLAASSKIDAVVPIDERFAAFAEMNDALGLHDGVVYTDSATWIAGGRDTRAYMDIILTGRSVPSKAFVVNSEYFNGHVTGYGEHGLKSQQEGATWRDALTAQYMDKVLRGMVVVNSLNTAYYYVMPTNVKDKLLITYYNKKRVKTQLTGSYSDMTPMHSQLGPRWYLLTSPPEAPIDFSFIRGKENITVHFARTGQWMASAALIEVTEPTVLQEANPNVMMVPLSIGWKEEK